MIAKIFTTSVTRLTGLKFERCTSSDSSGAAYCARQRARVASSLIGVYTSQFTKLVMVSMGRLMSKSAMVLSRR